MSNELEPANILVDLDCILDTRLGTILKMGTHSYLEIMKEGYHSRTTDYFEYLDMDRYRKMYEDRDLETLKLSQMTPVVDIIVEYAANVLHNALESPYKFEPTIIINTYPYKDLPQSSIDAIVGVFVGLTKGLATVKTCYRSFDQLHPAYVKRHLTAMVKYDYLMWLEKYMGDKSLSERFTMPEVTLLAPRVSLNDSEGSSELIEASEGLEKLMGIFIGLKVLDISIFSTKVTLEELARQAKRIQDQE